jgi:PEP-CTERM motif
MLFRNEGDMLMAPRLLALPPWLVLQYHSKSCEVAVMATRESVRLVGALIFAALTVALGVLPAAADSGCSTSTLTLATLASVAAEGGGSGCLQVGTTQFTDWSVSTSGDASLFHPAAVNVTPGIFGGNAGIQIQGGFTTTTDLDVIVQFEVEAVGVEGTSGNFTDAHLSLIAGATDTTGASGSIAEQVRGGGSDTPASCLINPCVPGVFDVDGPVLGSMLVSIAGSHDATITFAPQSELVIMKDFHLACPTGSTSPCTVSISDFQQAFSTTPEPATLFLLGSGLAGAGIFARRRMKRTAV